MYKQTKLMLMIVLLYLKTGSSNRSSLFYIYNCDLIFLLFVFNFRRGLNPPHRVKSISMASFSPEEMDFLKSHGNEVSL